MTVISDPLGTNGAAPSNNGMRLTATVLAGATAITEKMAVALVMADDESITAVPYDTDLHATGYPMAVALEDIAANGYGQVCVFGPCIVNTPAAGPSVGESIIGTTTAGTVDGLAVLETTVGGTTHGYFMTDEIGTTNTAWAFITNA